MNNTTQSLTVIALHKKKEFLGVFSFAFIVILVLVSIFAYVLAPDNSENANQMHLSIHSKPPGFNVNMLSIPLEERQERR
jgi:peptide/nickel transport system permease protein